MGIRILRASLPVSQSFFSADQKHAVLVLQNGSLEDVALADGKKRREWTPKGIPPPYVIQREGSWLVGRGPTGMLLGAHIGEDSIAFQTKAIAGAIGRPALAPSGKLMAVPYSDDRVIRLFSTSNGEQIGEVADGVGGSSLLMVSPDDKFLVAGAYDATLRVYDLATRKLMYQDLELPMALWCGTFGKDGDTYCFYAGSTDARFLRYRHGAMQRGADVLAKGLPANVNHVAALTDGSVVTLESNPASNALPVVARHYSGPSMTAKVVADLPKTCTHLDVHPGGERLALISDGSAQVRLLDFG